ncbi:uncharacterized protein B0I36DRAFT_369960 [Microdochium trichocladiopsis]|uniref:Uncharacterized protein n=1 Tax=Microdochium trichocladiopsis TaxID=1682393 RepID=A0A9P9BHQ4_9PEZI|nr:uncharacterized protein B0I36DRAFT_369960 [Microdochium trichocladiopsis]KAH7012151.1 hypothetical protein B0I36DRAFT_369960 [Microdochium trichocladiopsis]
MAKLLGNANGCDSSCATHGCQFNLMLAKFKFAVLPVVKEEASVTQHPGFQIPIQYLIKGSAALSLCERLPYTKFVEHLKLQGFDIRTKRISIELHLPGIGSHEIFNKETWDENMIFLRSRGTEFCSVDEIIRVYYFNITLFHLDLCLQENQACQTCLSRLPLDVLLR